MNGKQQLAAMLIAVVALIILLLGVGGIISVLVGDAHDPSPAVTGMIATIAGGCLAAVAVVLGGKHTDDADPADPDDETLDDEQSAIPDQWFEEDEDEQEDQDQRGR